MGRNVTSVVWHTHNKEGEVIAFVKKFINDLDYERIEQISQEKLEIINGADLDEKIKNETIQLLKRIKKIINFEDSNRVSLS